MTSKVEVPRQECHPAQKKNNSIPFLERGKWGGKKSMERKIHDKTIDMGKKEYSKRGKWRKKKRMERKMHDKAIDMRITGLSNLQILENSVINPSSPQFR